MDNLWLIAIVLGALLIIGLAFYAGKLLFKLQLQNKKEQAFLDEVKTKQAANNKHLIESVRYIAKAVREEQCELSEGAIRICTMLNNFAGQEDAYLETYPGFYQLFNAIKDFPTHQAFKDLSKQERMNQNMKRWNFEADVKEQMLEEAKLLQSFQKNLN
ncbi:DUF2489 domain-containing protein [Saccharobesus litoralis]|uniref:DUF2489 domain-containing protein n=1 Tax=Saccharobesus litoralis TaxID=2172099 RepID=A0A2S0VQY9_9ALTE|nr:DUF2489 domain-containing protein [Saccharobesus litoralis]AWB66635.1 DUF2489 domain-containing protein [Saccharobesus litoralis]